MRLAAVVLNFRTPEHTQLAVESLLSSTRTIDDLIVLNNDRTESDDGRRWAPPVRRIDTGRNLGFSGGMNIGIRAALASGADRVLIANSDITVLPDCIERLEATLESIASAGIAGPVVLSQSNPAIVQSVGMSYSLKTGRLRQNGFMADANSLRVPNQLVVDAVPGCLMLISRPVFDAIGFFHEDFFFSFEDLDFCLRARRAGFATVLSGQARALHQGSQSIGVASPRRFYFAARNHLLLASRADSGRSVWTSVLRTASIVTLNVAHAVTSRYGSRVERIGAVTRGTLDYFSGRFGNGERAEATIHRTPAQSATAINEASAADSL